MKILRRCCFIAAGVCCIVLCLWLRGVARQADARDPALLPDHDYLPEIVRLMAQGDLGGAEELCCAVIGLGLPNADAANVKLRECRQERNRWRRGAFNAFYGFLTGKGEDPAGMTGAIISDFFLYGDLRDLGIQFSRKIRGEPVDVPVAVFSGVGAAAGFIGLGKWFPAALKYLHRAGALTAGLLDHLCTALLQFRRSGVLSPAGKRLFTHLHEVIRRCGPAGVRSVLKNIRTPEELAAAVRLGKKAPEVPLLIARARDARSGELLVAFSAERSGIGLLKKAVRKGPRGVRLLREIRVVKWGAKNLLQGRFREMLLFRAVADPAFRRTLRRGGLFAGIAGLLLLLWGCRFSGARLLSLLQARRSGAAAPSRSRPGDNAPDSSSSGCSD